MGNREIHIALLAIAGGAAALFLLRALAWGTLEQPGPAAVPGIVAGVLLVAGVWHARHVFTHRSAPRAAPSWRNALPWLLLAVLTGLSLWKHDQLSHFRTGPAENLALMSLVLALMLAATWIAVRGSLGRLIIPILLGLLVALGDLMPGTMTTRLWDIEPGFVHGVLAAALLVALRLPVAGFILAAALGLQIEDALRRFLLLAHGDPLQLLSRPWAAGLAALVLLVLIALLIGRFRRVARR